MIFHDGYYYLFVNHGSCCSGVNSTFHICVGRSRTVTGPYLDRYGDDLAQGGGTLFVAAAGRQIRPGHFGLLVENGVVGGLFGDQSMGFILLGAFISLAYTCALGMIFVTVLRGKWDSVFDAALEKVDLEIKQI
jgi:hypothetical protein